MTQKVKYQTILIISSNTEYPVSGDIIYQNILSLPLPNEFDRNGQKMMEWIKEFYWKDYEGEFIINVYSIKNIIY